MAVEKLFTVFLYIFTPAKSVAVSLIQSKNTDFIAELAVTLVGGPGGLVSLAESITVPLGPVKAVYEDLFPDLFFALGGQERH